MLIKNKIKQVEDLSSCIGKAKAGFLVNFQGMNAYQMTNMRKELKKNDSEMKVFRNSLLKRALEKGFPTIKKHLTSYLTGSCGFVFAFSDPSSTAKIISHYVKETQTLKIKTGIMEGAPLSAENIKRIANLPSLEVLKAQLVAALVAPLRGLLSMVSQVPSGFLRTLDQYGKQKK